MTTKHVILGTPYVFARKKLAKPFHTEAVRLVNMFGAYCQNGCGLFYITAKVEPGRGLVPDVASQYNKCPDCKASPSPFKISSEPEEIEVAVRLRFGNLEGVDFLRSYGTVSTAPVKLAVFRP